MDCICDCVRVEAFVRLTVVKVVNIMSSVSSIDRVVFFIWTLGLI